MLQAQYRLADELKMRLSDVRSMSAEEFDGWFNYFKWKNDQDEKTRKKAKSKGKRSMR